MSTYQLLALLEFDDIHWADQMVSMDLKALRSSKMETVVLVAGAA
jgi:hypothetical protein